MVGDGRRWWVRGVAGMVMLMGLASCLSVPSNGGRDGSLRPVKSSAERAALERKIGQMVLVGFRGMSVDDAGLVVEKIRAGQVGGVVLFDVDVLNGQPVRNIRSPERRCGYPAQRATHSWAGRTGTTGMSGVIKHRRGGE